MHEHADMASTSPENMSNGSGLSVPCLRFRSAACEVGVIFGARVVTGEEEAVAVWATVGDDGVDCPDSSAWRPRLRLVKVKRDGCGGVKGVKMLSEHEGRVMVL